jgi:hypothetical protein
VGVISRVGRWSPSLRRANWHKKLLEGLYYFASTLTACIDLHLVAADPSNDPSGPHVPVLPRLSLPCTHAQAVPLLQVLEMCWVRESASGVEVHERLRPQSDAVHVSDWDSEGQQVEKTRSTVGEHAVIRAARGGAGSCDRCTGSSTPK